MRGALLLIAAAAAGLAACSTMKPATPGAALAAAPAPAPAVQAQVAPREVVVRVPVKSPCVPRALPPPPHYPDSDAALREAGGAADRYQLLAAGRILRAKRLAQLERVIDGCR